MYAAQSEPFARPTSATWVVVALDGEIGFGSTDALDVLDEAVREHPRAHVLVDLSHVTFLDSTALVAFARARSRAEATGGSLSLRAASDFARRLLEIWHLEPVREGAAQGEDAACAVRGVRRPARGFPAYPRRGVARSSSRNSVVSSSET